MFFRKCYTKNLLQSISSHSVLMALVVCFIIPVGSSVAQSTYFQQHVAYDIKVKLDDQLHQLNGFVSMQYTNNSPDTLHFIWIHLWPNAYAGRNTALSKQMLENGNRRLYFSKKEEQGFIDSLDFKSGTLKIPFSYDPVNRDIGKLQLNEPLLPGATIEINTPFHVKIPDGKFSRMGHIGESYQISQWYPKPAVYDQQGWHPMPYLDQGEFYSEFGTFKVQITIPENYLVAATGNLQEASERNWLLEKSLNQTTITNKDSAKLFPPSSTTFKTITFTQDSVHDFAWFADKRFQVMRSEFTLPESGKKIEAWAFYTNREAALWKSSLKYIEQGIRYYSSRVGAYPYSQYTAVDGTISAGGGMEYPMITVIGDANFDFTLETFIVHELGHSWFYGILGSNERDYGWMDEGINSFYEMSYVENHYPGESGKGKNDMVSHNFSDKIIGSDQLTSSEAIEQLFDYSAFDNIDQPINTPPIDFTVVDYGTVMYGKTALVLGFLQDYLGKESYDKAMHEYFNNWKFKHPGPGDFEQILKTTTGKNLDWLFKGLIATNGSVDYKICSSEIKGNDLELTLQNKGEIAAPFKIGETEINEQEFERFSGEQTILFKNYKGGKLHITEDYEICDSKIKEGDFELTIQNKGKIEAELKISETVSNDQWFEGFSGKQTIQFKNYKGGNLHINEDYVVLLKNNHFIYRNRILFNAAPKYKLRMLPKLTSDANEKTLLLLPMAGWNRYNGGMAGLTFSNFKYFPDPFEFTLVPLYDFKNNDIAGVGSLRYNIWPMEGLFQEIRLSADGKRFAYANNTLADDSFDPEQPVLNYSKLAPGIRLSFRKSKPRSKMSHTLLYRNISIWQDEVTYELKDTIYQRKNVNTYLNFHQLKYAFTNSRSIDPFNGYINLESGDHYTKLSGEFNYTFSYAKSRKGVNVRLFAGGFLDNTGTDFRNYNFRMSGGAGDQDYLYDEYYFGRSDDHGLWKQQFLIRDGGLKIPTAVGQSNQWIAALNLDIDIPIPLPISIFADLGTYEGISTIFEDLDNVMMYDVGIALKPFPGVFEVYFPLFYSDDINTALDTNDITFAEQIRFVLNINKLTPNAMRKIFLDAR